MRTITKRDDAGRADGGRDGRTDATPPTQRKGADGRGDATRTDRRDLPDAEGGGRRQRLLGALVLPQFPGQLVGAAVDCEDMLRPALQQYVGEAAGRTADVHCHRAARVEESLGKVYKCHS